MEAVSVVLLAMIAITSGEEQAVADPCGVRGCTADYKPVCATFVATFNNECEMTAKGCELAQQGIMLSRGYQGNMANGEEPCPHSCNQACTYEYDPRCGTDGNTYPNSCSMRVQSCTSKKWIEAVKRGPCEGDNPQP